MECYKMKTREECLAEANTSEGEAFATRDDHSRKLLLEIARRWRRVAEMIEEPKEQRQA